MISTWVPKIDGVRINQIESSSDSRGTFFKFHPIKELHDHLDSVALSFNPSVGTLRGLHFQVAPFAEEKLISCIQGSIFDVIVDIRPGSKTFGKWTSFELNGGNMVQLYLPTGLAHGFQTLLPDTIVQYCLTAKYDQGSSYVINPFGEMNIAWPLTNNIVSDKDKNGLTFRNAAEKYAKSMGYE
jgi:dTDP-4-dehydrorhamnose 3,5-epimerase